MSVVYNFRLALRHENGQVAGTSPLALTELDLATFMAPPQASPTENGCWPSVSLPVTGSPNSTHNFPPPTSPTLSSPPPTSPALSSSPTSPVDPWFFSHTPTDEISHSPNTAFLHSCQSPPSHTPFSTMMQAGGNDPKQGAFIPLESNARQDSFFPPEGTNNLFSQQDVVNGMFSSDSTFQPVQKNVNHSVQNNPFLSSQDLNPFHTDISSCSQIEARMVMTSPPQLSGSSCGSVQPAWNGDLFQGRKGNKVICS